MNRQPSSRMRISVVIPHLNQQEELRRCLKSLRAGRRPPDEIVVVDNGSKEIPTEICAALGPVTLLHQPTPGPGMARNLGVAETCGEVLAFIDADCIADPGWLEVAERQMLDPAAHILGGDVRIACENPRRLTPLEAYESIFAYRMDRYISREGFTGTGNLVMRRAVFEKVGPFQGLSVAEDREWGQRATQAGHQIRFIPELKVFHPARASFAELQAKWDRQMAHDMRECVARKDRVKWAAKALAMFASPLAELPRIAFSNRVKGPRNRMLALAVLGRIRYYRACRMVQLLAGLDPEQLLGRWNRSDAH